MACYQCGEDTEQGGGAAIILNNKFTDRSGITPILIPRVRYLSNDDRRKRILTILDGWCSWTEKAFASDGISDENAHSAALYLFDALVVEALSTKHVGFAEEREWRLVYLRHRDFKGELVPLFHYHVGTGGIEPKLKLPIKPPIECLSGAWSFEDILDRIIIGPAVSSPLATATFRRALECIGKEWIAAKVFSSNIPFRRVYSHAGRAGVSRSL